MTSGYQNQTLECFIATLPTECMGVLCMHAWLKLLTDLQILDCGLHVTKIWPGCALENASSDNIFGSFM